MQLCTYIKLFTTVPYRWQRDGRNLKPRIFGNFCGNSPPFLEHPVAAIAKIRHFPDGIWTVVQGRFLPVLHLFFLVLALQLAVSFEHDQTVFCHYYQSSEGKCECLNIVRIKNDGKIRRSPRTKFSCLTFVELHRGLKEQNVHGYYIVSINIRVMTLLELLSTN